MMNQEDTPRRIGDYEILGPIGKGAMGQVYKAVQPSLNRIVALKVLPEEFARDETKVERFSREAQAVALLNHPNIVQIIDKDRDEDTIYFVMEYVQGSSLDQVLRRRRLSLQESISVFKSICKGLQAAHAENIVHRDLNPRNVLVSEDLSLIKLADFGISRVESISRDMGTLSTQGMGMGSLHYMAPEQAIDLMSADHRSDIYSAGVVLYEMLTGRVPVGRFSLPSQLNSEVPPEIDPLVLKCLASEPGDRYASVDQILTALAAAEDHLRLGLVSELRGISRSTSKILKRSTESFSGRRKKMIFGGVGALVIALLAGGYFLFGPGGDSEAPVQVAESPRFISPDTPPPPPPPVPTTDGEEAGSEETAGQEDLLAEKTAEADTGLPEEAEATAGADTGLPEEAEATAGADLTELEEAPEPEPQVQETPNPAGPEQPTPTPAVPEQDPVRAEQERQLQVASDKLQSGLERAALTDLESFLEEFPNSPYTWEAHEMMSQASLRMGRRLDAMGSLVEFSSLNPQHPKTPEALYKLGLLTLESSGADRDMDALKIFRDLINEYPNSQWVPRALAAKGQIEKQRKMQINDPALGTVPTALVTYRRLTEEYPTNSASEKGLWELAGLYDQIKDFDLAARAYLNLANKFPTTRYDVWWEAAQLLEKKLDKDPEALAAYRRVPVTSKNFNAAQRRINKLDK